MMHGQQNIKQKMYVGPNTSGASALLLPFLVVSLPYEQLLRSDQQI
jgi:hypothetical protein